MPPNIAPNTMPVTLTSLAITVALVASSVKIESKKALFSQSELIPHFRLFNLISIILINQLQKEYNTVTKTRLPLIVKSRNYCKLIYVYSRLKI